VFSHALVYFANIERQTNEKRTRTWKKTMRNIYKVLMATWTLLASAGGASAEIIARGVEFTPGAVNSVHLQGTSKSAIVYGVANDTRPAVDLILLSHHRRDVLWAARPLVDAGAKAIAPLAERALIEKPEEFWEEFRTKRFHDYAQQSTKILDRSLAVERWVVAGDEIDLGGIKLQVIETPGFTRGSISYVTDVDNTRIVFTGDMIYAPGKILDLYSFQDAIAEAKIGGYHGYGGRLSALVASIDQMLLLKPDVLVPLRGEVMRRPTVALTRLKLQVQQLYKDYLSTTALNWYFKQERMTLSAKGILDEKQEVSLMPYSLHEETPEWIWVHGTSRLVIAENGYAMLIDCGNDGVIDAVKDLIERGLVKQVDSIFVTHYHDDHTNSVQKAAEFFRCPVYAVALYVDILENPGNYHMPCLHHNPIKDVVSKQDGETMMFHEFKMTFHSFPGQTFYHGALLVEKDEHLPVYFIGDAFSPSGMDDYCVLNRNLMHENDGYLMCLDRVRKLGDEYWLINEHIPHIFRFTESELDYLETQFRKRIKTVSKLIPWDDPNYGVDEQWAMIYPYGSTSKKGEIREFEIALTNHSSRKRRYDVKLRIPEGAKIVSLETSAVIAGGTLGVVRAKVQMPSTAGLYLIRVDIASQGIDVRDWIEAMVVVD
jgi:glyoxylase-like metal-dependent hydrolase (beta-lactamase superfamily II)